MNCSVKKGPAHPGDLILFTSPWRMAGCRRRGHVFIPQLLVGRLSHTKRPHGYFLIGDLCCLSVRRVDGSQTFSYSASVITAILLASGESRRFGSDKLFWKIKGIPLIDRALRAVLESTVDEIVVVCSPEVAKHIAFTFLNSRCRIIVNRRPGRGMSASIRAGLRAVSARSAAVMIAHADMPFIDSKIVNRLLRAYRAKPKRIVAPCFCGQQGNPVMLPRKHWSSIWALRGDVGCKSILKKNPLDITWVRFKDNRILRDVDLQQDLRRPIKRS